MPQLPLIKKKVRSNFLDLCPKKPSSYLFNIPNSLTKYQISSKILDSRFPQIPDLSNHVLNQKQKNLRSSQPKNLGSQPKKQKKSQISPSLTTSNQVSKKVIRNTTTTVSILTVYAFIVFIEDIFFPSRSHLFRSKSKFPLCIGKAR